MYRIICISDSDKHFSSAISEYLKRMWKTCEIQNIKPIKYGSKEQIIEKETALLIEKIEKRKKKWDRIILLSKEWKIFSTQDFTTLLTKAPTFCFIIWWPYGIDEKKLWAYIDQSISFWGHTMPHGLAKLVLIEQLYRSSMIQSWRSYHY